MSLGSRGYRKAIAGRERILRRVSTECERMMFHVWYGKESSAVGLVELDSLASRLRVDAATLDALIVEAQNAGLLVWSPDVDLVYATGSFQQDPPAAHNNFKGYLNEIALHPDCRARDACIQELGQWQGSWQPGTTFEPPSNPVQRMLESPSNPGAVAVTVAKQEQEQNRNRTSTPAPAAPAPAFAEAQALELRQQKAAKRELTPAQERAILNRQLARAAIVEWHKYIGKTVGNAHATAEWERRAAKVVAQAVASLGGVSGFGGLCQWAEDHSPYDCGHVYPDKHGNEVAKGWTIEEWCAAAHIDKLYSKCKTHLQSTQGRNPRFTYDPSREVSAELLPKPEAA